MARSNTAIDQRALNYSINQMSEHDLLEVVEIEQVCALSPWGWDSYHNEISSGRCVIMLVAKVDGAADIPTFPSIAGFLVSRVFADELHVNNVAVRPEYQRLGIGGGLLRAALEQVSAQGSKAAFLEVRASNQAAQALYRHCGFHAVGRRRDYYRNPTEDALIMSLSLPFKA